MTSYSGTRNGTRARLRNPATVSCTLLCPTPARRQSMVGTFLGSYLVMPVIHLLFTDRIVGELDSYESSGSVNYIIFSTVSHAIMRSGRMRKMYIGILVKSRIAWDLGDNRKVYNMHYFSVMCVHMYACVRACVCIYAYYHA